MKKRFYQMLLIAAISTFVISGCTLNPLVTGSETMTQEEIAITDFKAVDISHSFSAEIIQSGQYKVVVSYNSNLKEYLNVEKDRETLKVGLDNEHQYRNVKLAVKIYMPELSRIDASGASKINISDYNTNDLGISLSGASELTGKLNVLNNLKIESSGASDMNLMGLSKNASFSFSGASEFKGKGMTIMNDLNVECSGASNVVITANGNISLELSGASDVKYYGNGKIVKSNTSGASSIKKMEGDTI